MNPYLLKTVRRGDGTTIAFTRFVDNLEKLIDAERDAVGLPCHDLAFDTWLSEAEAARTAVIEAADAVVFPPCRTVADLRFRIIARDFETMMLTSDPVRYASKHEFLSTAGWLYSARGLGQKVGPAATLLRACQVRFAQLFALPDYAPETQSCTTASVAAAA